MRYQKTLQKPYIVLEDKNFDFSYEEVNQFDEWMQEGMELHEISLKWNRNQLEVFMLYLDRVDKGVVEPIYRIVKV